MLDAPIDTHPRLPARPEKPPEVTCHEIGDLVGIFHRVVEADAAGEAALGDEEVHIAAAVACDGEPAVHAAFGVGRASTPGRGGHLICTTCAVKRHKRVCYRCGQLGRT